MAAPGGRVVSSVDGGSPLSSPGFSGLALSSLRSAAIRRAVIVNLGAQFSLQVRWSAVVVPALKDVQFLSSWAGCPSESSVRRFLLLDDSQATPFELADGNVSLAMSRIQADTRCQSLDDLAAAYRRFVYPSRLQAATRHKYWRLWRVVLTWGVAWRALDRLIPMSEDTLMAFSWDLMQCGCSADFILGCWIAIQSRHRSFRLIPPIAGPGEFQKWRRSQLSISGGPTRFKLPITRRMVVALAESRPSSLRAIRDKMSALVGTICCLRASEIAQLQACDVLFDHHVACGGSEFRGTAAVRIIRRKNDPERRGHWPVIGVARDPRRRVVFQLRTYMRLLKLRVHLRCGKQSRPGARCQICPPLFPRLRATSHGRFRAASESCTRQMISDGIKRAVSSLGIDAAQFSAISARKGGLSTAIEAGVSEEVLYLQSGHGLQRAGRTYMHLRSPARLLSTFESFRL
eukprot:CAMPEP_0113682712 /NCGR_PEP_ID=MMETSP0038_2-20120614/12838_1 /TAXON_ID=2898 /ORGANISM="Cryptomonas paramecium" /LENGTH=459 /DNA_ID=CAMNT_0000601857 /DNA_START=862 /DNA_END=2241 /DNA_ORIENTATION=- /assembly_acc=CAM_ASM_000170